MNIRPIGEAIPEPIVRPYTAEEREQVRPGEKEDAAAKLERIQRTVAIDRERYEEAMAQHPEKQEHFARLIAVGEIAVTQWAEYYEAQIAPDNVVGAIPYDGSEAPTTVAVHATEPEGAYLPA